MCLVYERPEDQWAAIMPLAIGAFERRHRLAYVTDDRSSEDVIAAMHAAGMDVAEYLRRGALVFPTTRDAYLRSGSFDPAAMLQDLRDLTQQAFQDGFSGFCITGEMTWALGDECGCERLIEYEALLNDFFPGSRAYSVCQYNRRRFRAEMIRDVLRTHPLAALGDQVCANLYYETPEMVRGRESADARVDWMIGQLRRFRAAEKELEDAVRVRDESLSVASHELKTPLTSLTLYLQGLLGVSGRGRGERGSGPLTPRQRDQLGKALKQTHRLGELVTALLDLSRIMTGRLEPDPEPIDFIKVVRAIAEQFGEHAESPISIVSPASLVGTCDRRRLEQIVVNLVSNAVKYGDRQPIELRVGADGDDVVIAVRDRGIGIPAEDQARIFDRFERAVSSRHYSGLGLGLWIASETVRMLGGTIRVESAPAQGSTFVVRLPRGEAGRAIRDSLAADG